MPDLLLRSAIRPALRPALRSPLEKGVGGWWSSAYGYDVGLAIDFANNRTYNAGVSSTPYSLLTYTAPSAKIITGSDGVLRYANHNLMAYSATYQTNWTFANCTYTAGTVSPPTADGLGGTVTAIATPTIRPSWITASAPTTATGAVYSATIYAKAGTHSFIQFYINNQGTDYANFNLSTGAVGTTGGAVTSSIVSLGGGWYRCHFSWIAGSTDRYPFAMLVASASATRAAFWSPAGTETIFIGGFQMHLGATAFTYLPTTTATKYDIPIDYDPLTLACKGVLIEEARTNLRTYSEQLNTGWVTQNVTITANTAVAPDGTTTADTMTEDTMTNNHGVSIPLAKAASAITYTFSVYAKIASGTRNLYLFIEDNTYSNRSEAIVNLSSGAVVLAATNYGTFTAGSVSVTAAGNGYWRVAITATSNTALSVACRVQTAIGSSSAGWLGDGTSGIYVWGAQLEAGAFATSYIPTVASQVTRAADQLSLLTSAFGYNAAEGALFVNYIAPLGVAQDIVWIANGLAESLGFYINVVPAVLLWCRAGGATQAAVTIGTLLGPSNKVAGAFKINDFSGSSNGATVATDTVGTMPTPTSLQFSPKSIVGVSASIYIKSLAYWPTRKSDAYLQQVTT